MGTLCETSMITCNYHFVKIFIVKELINDTSREIAAYVREYVRRYQGIFGNRDCIALKAYNKRTPF